MNALLARMRRVRADSDSGNIAVALIFSVLVITMIASLVTSTDGAVLASQAAKAKRASSDEQHSIRSQALSALNAADLSFSDDPTADDTLVSNLLNTPGAALSGSVVSPKTCNDGSGENTDSLPVNKYLVHECVGVFVDNANTGLIANDPNQNWLITLSVTTSPATTRLLQKGSPAGPCTAQYGVGCQQPAVSTVNGDKYGEQTATFQIAGTCVSGVIRSKVQGTPNKYVLCTSTTLKTDRTYIWRTGS